MQVFAIPFTSSSHFAITIATRYDPLVSMLSLASSKKLASTLLSPLVASTLPSPPIASTLPSPPIASTLPLPIASTLPSPHMASTLPSPHMASTLPSPHMASALLSPVYSQPAPSPPMACTLLYTNGKNTPITSYGQSIPITYGQYTPITSCVDSARQAVYTRQAHTHSASVDPVTRATCSDRPNHLTRCSFLSGWVATTAMVWSAGVCRATTLLSAPPPASPPPLTCSTLLT